MTGSDHIVRYPYSMTGKVMNYPWKFHWQNGRYVRYLTYAILLTTPLIYKIHKAVHAPANMRQWDEIRRNREHTHFEPLH